MINDQNFEKDKLSSIFWGDKKKKTKQNPAGGVGLMPIVLTYKAELPF